MNEPLFFGVPISLAFLYFIIYSVLGWCMETIYCSVAERRLVPRGFLYGPLCPIYGVGVLMMICWFHGESRALLCGGYGVYVNLGVHGGVVSGDHHPYEVLGLQSIPL